MNIDKEPVGELNWGFVSPGTYVPKRNSDQELIDDLRLFSFTFAQADAGNESLPYADQTFLVGAIHMSFPQAEYLLETMGKPPRFDSDFLQLARTINEIVDLPIEELMQRVGGGILKPQTPV